MESDRLFEGDASVAMVDAIATVDESGRSWSVAMMNRHPSDEVTCTLQLGDRLVDGTFQATLLTGASPDAYNDIQHPDRVTPAVTEVTFKAGAVRLPPHSLCIVEVPLTR